MHQLTPLSNDEFFESFICDLFNQLYSTKSFNKFGKQGQNQKGIDIYSKEKRIVIQCKKKDITRPKQTLKRELFNDIATSLELTTISELKVEFDTFIIVSTYSDSTELIEYCSELKTTNKCNFHIDYWGWETLSSQALKYPTILKKYWSDFTIQSPDSHQNIKDLKKKKRMEKDFALWNDYDFKNRERRSRMIIKKFDSNLYPEDPFDPTINIYTWGGAEFDKISHDGVDFFAGNEIIYVNDKNEWSLEQENDDDKIVSVSRIGRIAFKDIIEYDMKGDEYYGCPIFLCDYCYNGTPYFKYHYRDIKTGFVFD